ncbi:MAG: DUF1552 domain-containing protein [Verrucomicrobiales bacterium]|nr:DUF1552 domain-containing protein [Verrucomicrobiales bacterium]
MSPRNATRRQFLQASGISLGLPLLEAFGKAAETPPKRALFICNTLGFYSPAFFPGEAGPDYEASEYLALLEDHRDDFTVFSGLSHPDQGGEHQCEMTWLSAARNPGRDGFRNSLSVDQFAASRLGYVTRFPSLSLSSDGPMSQSYTASGVMIPAMERPSEVFAKLFLQGRPDDVKREKQKLSDGRSILDALGDERTRLLGNASPMDREKLDAYFEAVRQAERDITEAEAWFDRPKPKVDAEAPQDIADKADLVGRIELLFQLVPLVIQTDSSRVISIVIQNNHGIPLVNGVDAEHHNLSHHGRDPDKIDQLKKIERAILHSVDQLLARMKLHEEAGASLLDQTLTLLGSNLGNAASHDPRNNPVLLAGGGLNHGGYHAHDETQNTPLSNLYVRMLQEIGIETDSFASSSGLLDWS